MLSMPFHTGCCAEHACAPATPSRLLAAAAAACPPSPGSWPPASQQRCGRGPAARESGTRWRAAWRAPPAGRGWGSLWRRLEALWACPPARLPPVVVSVRVGGQARWNLGVRPCYLSPPAQETELGTIYPAHRAQHAPVPRPLEARGVPAAEKARPRRNTRCDSIPAGICCSRPGRLAAAPPGIVAAAAA